MALPKLYEQITWVNNTTPALNEDNLNAMSQALEDIDNRVVDVASTIMEDVPIIEEALKHLDPPIRVEKDYAPIQVLTDAIDKPVIDLKVKVDPVQDLHGYTKPWVGGAGKNKANIADAVVTEAGYVYNNAPLVLPSGTYTFSFESTATSGDYTIVFRDADNTELARANKNMGVKYATFTLASACAKFTLAVSATGTYSHFQIEVGSTATTYEPYTNICPITGHSEVKVGRSGELPFGFIQGGIIDNTGAETDSNVRIKTDYIKYNGDSHFKLYMISGMEANDVLRNIYYYSADKQFINSAQNIETGWNAGIPLPYDATLNIPTNTAYYRLVVQKSDPSLAISPTNKSMVNHVTIFTIDLDGTRYGGVLDVDAGTLTVKSVSLSLTTPTWTKQGSYFFSSVLPDVIKRPYDVNTKADMICSCFEVLPQGDFTSKTSIAYFYTNSSTSSSQLLIYCPQAADATALGTILSGQTLCYALQTPITVQLTPAEVELLWAYNTLFADTGDLSLTYDASGVLRIAGPLEDRVDALEGDKADKSDLASISITGTTNSTGSTIASGTYFYLNGALVKAKTSIANSATLTENTNYTKVTAGGLNEISSKLLRVNVQSIGSQTITAGGVYQWAVAPVSITGYTPVGVVGHYLGSNSYKATVYVSRYTSVIQFGVRNEESIDITINPDISILYVKDGCLF